MIQYPPKRVHLSLLIANGQIEDLAHLAPWLKIGARIVAIDGGLIYCKELGIIPELIVGDFDSVPKALLEEYQDVPKISLPIEKDQTDLEYALEHELQHNKTVILFGVLGARVDHSLTNLLLATRYPGKVFIDTERETIFAIQQEAKIESFIGQTISLIPINGPVTGITTKGLQWELNKGTLSASFIGISNVAKQKEIHITIGNGILLCAVLKSIDFHT